ncbi:DUF885 domain-containing protein [Faecalicatena contorta]|uniref:DUF885 domain-containing protein n=1 Tax=Faecalicatena contorta TaxID=39482 RepID=UPI001961F223|nr:DUF885 domain-containing protein [Faecalicatena contorta]MBM6686641.1 DUF885 domain-containing protein [Faecalicatena contorta]MBM6709931.1 DUF885 domain-containing protein [Faecalicatena contorta]
MRKKCTSLMLLVCLLLPCLTSCSLFPGPDENDLFRQFTLELFRQEVAADTITLHYTVKEPESYGIQDAPVTLGSFGADTAASAASLENCLALLEDFRYKKLSPENQLTFDVLKSWLETALQGSPYALYEEPLSPLTGVQAQLPILLCEFSFDTPEDVDTYLALLEEVPAYFDSLISFEQAKSRAGLFMSSRNAQDVLDECAAFTALGDSHYLFSSFQSRLEKLTELTDSQKEACILQHRDLVYDCLFPAYNRLTAAVSALKDTGTNECGLCYYPDGKKYYEYIVKRDTGSARTVPQLQNLTREQMMEDLSAMQSVAPLSQGEGEAPEETKAASASIFTLDDSNPEAILADLREKTASSFPSLPEVTAEIKFVQEEMAEYVSPAFYMVPAVDNAEENVIYINQGHLPDDLTLFTTLAHEGYPGHLYQNVYYASTDPDPVRSLLSFGGYTEGWAIYVEMLSYYFTGMDEDRALLEQRNASVILGLYALADMGIHYDGWSLTETVAFFRSFGITDTETIRDIYDLILGDPGNYLKYYIGYVEFLELKKTAVREWGEDFSQKRFHKAVLDTGPAPFEIVERAVREAR